MRTHVAAKPKLPKRSLTDSILKLCASGRFGVREAIATAVEQRKKTEVSSSTRAASAKAD
jgi:hypothetical protein